MIGAFEVSRNHRHASVRGWVTGKRRSVLFKKRLSMQENARIAATLFGSGKYSDLGFIRRFLRSVDLAQTAHFPDHTFQMISVEPLSFVPSVVKDRGGGEGQSPKG